MNAVTTAVHALDIGGLGALRERLHVRWRAGDASVSNDIEEVALTMLAHDMRAQHGEAARVVVLCESDQGSFLEIEAVLSADGARLGDEYAHDTYVAASDLAWGSALVRSYSSVRGRSRFGGPAWHVCLDHVLTGTPVPVEERVVSDAFVPLA